MITILGLYIYNLYNACNSMPFFCSSFFFMSAEIHNHFRNFYITIIIRIYYDNYHYQYCVSLFIPWLWAV